MISILVALKIVHSITEYKASWYVCITKAVVMLVDLYLVICFIGGKDTFTSLWDFNYKQISYTFFVCFLFFSTEYAAFTVSVNEKA